ncbi:helix-turn-helix domain-containing protein [Nocardia fluminea]|uniref:helix-turn-helix domain-containing protein n=1 Tax=Nocardia fluminea TaxID=134984 RepID=UPI003664D4D2
MARRTPGSAHQVSGKLAIEPEKDLGVDPLVVLADRVRELRESVGLSQRTLAKQIAYSRTIVNRVERARWPVSWESVRKIVAALGVVEDQDPAKDEMADWKSLWQNARDRHVEPLPTVLLFHGHRLRREIDGVQFELLRPGDPEPETEPAELGPALVRPRGYRQDLYLPDPAAVRTVERYVDALRRLRASVDNPSYRSIAAKVRTFAVTPDGIVGGGLAPSHTTLHDMFKPGRVELRWEVVMAFLSGCGLNSEEIRHWHKLFQRLNYRPRAKFLRQIDEHSPPPEIDLDGVTTVAEYVGKLRALQKASKRSMDKVLSTAKIHPGSYIPRRSTVFRRFREAEETNTLVERDIVVSFLRGCYCRTDGYRCVPDCKADLIEPWMRVYDGLQGRKRRDPRKFHFPHLDSAMARLERGFRETG